MLIEIYVVTLLLEYDSKDHVNKGYYRKLQVKMVNYLDVIKFDGPREIDSISYDSLKQGRGWGPGRN